MMREALCRVVQAPGSGALVLLLAALALGMTLVGPSARLERRIFDYVFVLDITQSMNTTDYALDGRPISRLAYAKHAVDRAIGALPCGSRVGLGAFTEYRSVLLLAPIDVCDARDELRATLAHIDGRMAWAGASEVAKGFYSALRLVRELDSSPALVFVTDGHEAPPLHPRHRPTFTGRPGEVAGLVVGAGGFVPMPIPKYDMAGNALGYWSADDVLQTDVYSRGRTTGAGETMVEEDGTRLMPVRAGREHLSMLKEPHLRSLARETGLGYRRLTTADELIAALQAPELARRLPVSTDLRPAAGLAALVCLVWVYGGRRAVSAMRARRRRRPARAAVRPY